MRNITRASHLSQVEADFSLVGELKKNVPKAENLKDICENASTMGTGIAALWSELHHSAEQMYAYGPMTQLKNKAKQKLRAFL